MPLHVTSIRSPTGAALLLVCAAALVALALPPRAATAPDAAWHPARTMVAGAFHVHTDRSDGTGSVDDVAAAARRAHLQFVVVTDHGDATRAPDAPSYRSGVLLIDGVEISTAGGHYAAVGLPASPYPLAGEARDVVEDVARLGGFGVAAHADSPKPDLQWRDWTAPVDGIEWLNLDTAWRASSRVQVARALLAYWIRAPEALASMTARPVELLRQWDALGTMRPVVSLAATDAHTRTLPSYTACFQTLSTRVELERPLTGRADADARAIVTALRAGHHHTVVDALASPAAFEFTARRDGVAVGEGDALAAGAPVTFEVRAEAPAGATLVLVRDGVTVAATRQPHLMSTGDGQRSTYRAEVRLAHAPGHPPIPWVVSNAITIGLPARDERRPVLRGEPVADLMRGGPGAPAWAIEHDPQSVGSVAVRQEGGEPALAFRYALGPGRPSDQFVALVTPVESRLAASDRIAFTARASRPMRIAVQLRPAGRDNPPRWQRSVYLDDTPRTVSIAFADLRAVPRDVTGPVPLPTIGALMFVVDTNNTQPGTAGEVVFSEIGLEQED